MSTVKETTGYQTTDGVVYLSSGLATANQSIIDSTVKKRYRKSFYDPFLENLSLAYPEDFSIFYNKTAGSDNNVKLDGLLSKYSMSLAYMSDLINNENIPETALCFAPITYVVQANISGLEGDKDIDGLKITSTSLGNQLLNISDTFRMIWKVGDKSSAWECYLQRYMTQKGSSVLSWVNIFSTPNIGSGVAWKTVGVSDDTFKLVYDTPIN